MMKRHDTHQTPRSVTHGSARSEEYGELQRLVNELYAHNMSGSISKIDILTRAEMDDLCDDLMEVVELLPAGSYKRVRLCDQLNSIITAHGWGYVYGTVE
ncbi:MAG: hypothetical protein ACOYJL_05630 [Tractidigestivibacter sp.]|jgi:hypothetical protein